MKNFKKLNEQKQNEIYGGSFLGIASTLMPLVAQGLGAIGTFFKIINSQNGQIDLKNGVANWNNNNSNSTSDDSNKKETEKTTPTGPTIIAF